MSMAITGGMMISFLGKYERRKGEGKKEMNEGEEEEES